MARYRNGLKNVNTAPALERIAFEDAAAISVPTTDVPAAARGPDDGPPCT
jgi:hypothetical protein